MNVNELKRQRAQWVKRLAGLEHDREQFKCAPSRWIEINSDVDIVRRHIQRIDDLLAQWSDQ